jgi:metal transporter CNNM
MFKHKILLNILFLILFSIITSKQILVEFDEENNLIIFNNVKYFPELTPSFSSNFKTTKNIQINSLSTTLSSFKNENELLTPNSFEEKEQECNCEEELVHGSKYWLFLFITLCLTLFAGLMSGLTVGYLSVDDLSLELKTTTGTDQEKEYAAKVLPILSNRHWLLCTLLLMNSFANEAMPVFLDRIFNRFTAVVISVTLLLVFGEVIPQALCTGPRQIQIASMAAPLTRFLMVISWPLSFWIGKALDIILGEHHKSRFENRDLKALIELHTYKALKKLAEEEEQHKYIPKEDIPRPGSKMGLNDMEANLMISALEIREKKAIEIMIKFKDVYSLNYDEKLTKFKIIEILEKGFSRIPVFSNNNKNDIIGLLRLKQLIGYDSNENKSIREIGISLKKPLVIPPSMKLVDLLREFRKGKSHMAFITEQVEKLQMKLGLNRTNSLIDGKMFYSNFNSDQNGILILGILTLEDVIENIFNLEILDEDDYDKIKKENLGGRTKSNINMYFTREVAETFINQQSKKIDELIKDSLYKKNQKEEFLNKMDNYEFDKSPSQNKSNLKELLI